MEIGNSKMEQKGHREKEGVAAKNQVMNNKLHYASLKECTKCSQIESNRLACVLSFKTEWHCSGIVRIPRASSANSN